jgi:peptidoglycan hydrolase CwlO-like protein
MTKYKFVTIVAPEAVRNEFTALRDSLNSSDKELMQAFWNLGIDCIDRLKCEVEMLQASAAAERLEKKELKLAAKPKAAKPAKKAAVKAKKTATKKAKKEAKPSAKVMFEGREEPEIFVGLDDDDVPCLVVDGTN